MNFDESQTSSNPTIAARPYGDWYEYWQAPAGSSVRTVVRPSATLSLVGRAHVSPASDERCSRLGS